VAADDRDLAAHHAVRRAVFVGEQAVFADDDRDERDGLAGTLHIVGPADGTVGGAVRAYPLDDEGLWKGDRLAVLAAHRRGRLGMLLVRFAVHSGGLRGGRVMIAHVQPANVRFFEFLGWSRDGAPEEFHGRPHQRMAIPLG
jgi:putative N-acetyltransferase (TIGR04045 family)